MRGYFGVQHLSRFRFCRKIFNFFFLSNGSISENGMDTP